MAEQNSYIVRGNDICFGLDGVTVPWGVVTSVKRKPSRSSEKFVGESGNTESVVYWDPQETVTLDVIRGGKQGQKASSLPVPQIGDKVEFESTWKIWTIPGSAQARRNTRWNCCICPSLRTLSNQPRNQPRRRIRKRQSNCRHDCRRCQSVPCQGDCL